MDYKKFQKMSMRTMPFQGQPSNTQELYNVLGNYALGVMGEWHELQAEINKVEFNKVPSMELVNKIEKELGDVVHYLCGLLTIMQEDFDESKLVNLPNESEIHEDLSNIAEIIKKYVFHGHKVDSEKFINSIYRVISHLDKYHTMNMSRILEKNIEKLKMRYPEKFTVADSIARVDEEELVDFYHAAE